MSLFSFSFSCYLSSYCHKDYFFNCNNVLSCVLYFIFHFGGNLAQCCAFITLRTDEWRKSTAKKERIGDLFRFNVHLSLNPGDYRTLLKVLKVVVFLRETCNGLYLLFIVDLKNVVFFWKKLCEVMEIRPVLYILSLSCLDK